MEAYNEVANRFNKQSWELLDYVTVFEDRYFKDMNFELKELKDIFLKYQIQNDDGTWDTCYEQPFFGISGRYRFFYEEMSKDYVIGYCDTEKKEIHISKKIESNKKEVKNVLLHEMIHGYEDIIPETYRQYLVIFLYQRLIKKLGKRKLCSMILEDQHSLRVEHSLLFLLKSLTLDIARRLPHGTIMGYGREEYFN